MKVDILLATYNGEKYLQEQLNSILNQSYTDFKLLISDDKSTDKTINILKKYEKMDNRIKVFYQKKNLGYIKNFEFLIKKSTNNFIMFSDQDDIWRINKIESQLAYLLESKVDLVYSDVELVNQNLSPIDKSYYEILNIAPLEGNKWKNILFRNPIIGNTVIVKKELLDQIREIPKEIPHDWYIGIIASMRNGIKFQNIPLTKYRIHSNNTSGVQTNVNSLKTKLLKYSYLEFINWRNGLIQERIEFLITLKNNLKFNDDYHEQYEYINQYISYLNKLKEKKYIYINILDFFRFGIYLDIKIFNKGVFLFILHIPCLFNVLVCLNRILEDEKDSIK